MPKAEILRELDKETLVQMVIDGAKNWLAHDGLWFQAVEAHLDLEQAIELDTVAWEQFTAIEARRIMARHGIEYGGRIEALEKALKFRLYAFINEQTITRVDQRTLRFEMNDCRVQAARKRKGLPDFPCRPVGEVEYAGFARTIDPRITSRCVVCPPDPHPDALWCAWEFTLSDDSCQDEGKE